VSAGKLGRKKEKNSTNEQYGRRIEQTRENAGTNRKKQNTHTKQNSECEPAIGNTKKMRMLRKE
jgi:hypothetical protein